MLVHRHGGIGLLTPETVHAGRAPEVTAARALTLDAAYQAHPERYGSWTALWVNPPEKKEVPPQ